MNNVLIITKNGKALYAYSESRKKEVDSLIADAGFRMATKKEIEAKYGIINEVAKPTKKEVIISEEIHPNIDEQKKHLTNTK